MAATNGPILNLFVNAPSRACAPQLAFAPCLKPPISEFQNQDTDLPSFPALRVSASKWGLPNQVNIHHSTARQNSASTWRAWFSRKTIKGAQDSRSQGLPLRGGRNPAMGGQMAQEGIDLSFSHLGRVGLAAIELDVPKYPIAVSLFGPIRVMVVPQHLTDLLHQFQFRIGPEF
jgi:hypothetical protein